MEHQHQKSAQTCTPIDNTAPNTLVLEPFMEGDYYHLWTDIPTGKDKQPGSQPVPPTSVKIPRLVTVSAKPIYMHRVGRKEIYVPVVAETPQKFLRPVNGPSLLPNTYLFCGPITARDRYLHEGDPEPAGSKSGREWRVYFIVDCGVPLNFHFGLEYYNRSVPRFVAEDAETGIYVAGLAQLQDGSDSGLHQPISATAVRIQVLSLDPGEDWFGSIQDVPYGYLLHLDPDTIGQPFVFMTIRIDEIAPVRYTPFPARKGNCPEPQI